MTISTFPSQVIGVVDAASSGVYLAPAFMSAGYRCVHISSAAEKFPGSFAGALRYFEGDVPYDGNLETLVAALAHYEFAHVVAGSETGVELADQLSYRLGLATSNGVRHSLARRDKFAMQEALRLHDVPRPRTCSLQDAREALAWANGEGGWPIVIKPLRSCGTDRVRICRNEQEVTETCSAILGEPNALGVMNTGFVAQQFLKGDEYMINSVSARGEHRVLEMWRSHKKPSDGVPLYDHLELMSPRSREFQILAQYTDSVLSALGIEFGAGHTEAMLDAETPMLIESASRLQGNINPAAMTRLRGSNQVQDTITCYVAPEKFLSRSDQNAEPTEHCMVVMLHSPVSGVLGSALPLHRIHALESFHSMRLRQPVTSGTRIPRTTGLFTTLGSVYLIHGDRRQLERDMQAVREMEAADFYSGVLS